MANRIVFLKRAIVDLHWFRIYHDEHFPEGLANAAAGMDKCVRLLAAFPKMGRVVGKSPRRRLSVPKIPCTIIYEHRGDVVDIIRILDQRSESYLDEIFEES